MPNLLSLPLVSDQGLLLYILLRRILDLIAPIAVVVRYTQNPVGTSNMTCFRNRVS